MHGVVPTRRIIGDRDHNEVRTVEHSCQKHENLKRSIMLNILFLNSIKFA